MIAPLALLLATAQVPTPSGNGAPPPLAGRAAVDALEFPALVFEPPLVEEHEIFGVPVLYLRDPGLPLVDVQIQVQGGIGHFPRDQFGALTALAPLLRSGGTRQATPDSVEHSLDLLAAQVSIGSSGGGTSVALNVLSDRLAPALILLGEMLLEPGFSSEALETWRGQETARIRGRENNPGSLAFSEFNRLMYGDHPVGWVMREDELSPEALSAARLASIHEALFCRGRLLVGVSGDVSWDEAEGLLAVFLAPWRDCAASLPVPPAASPREEPGVFVLPRQVEQSTIIVAESSPVRLGDSPEYFASRIADFVLGGSGLGSRIASRVRSEEGLAYGASSVWTAPILYDGVLGGLTASGARTTVQATLLLLQVMEEFRSAPPTEVEVREASERTAAGYVFAFESPSQIVARQMSYRLQRLPNDWLSRYLQGVQEVTVAQVAAVVEDHLDPDRMTILIVGDPSRFGPGLETLGPIYELSTDGSYRPWVNPPFGPGGSPQSPL